jgi:peptidoglycan/LPS O-acetylase OafA/YrhL
MAPSDDSRNPPTLERSYEEFRSRRFFCSLDGLRAVSVIAVIWHHTAPRYNEAMPYLLANGFHGVTLFFAISGFLIVTLLLRERERTGQIDLKAFYFRRSLRIFPLYYTVVATYALLVTLVERTTPAGREFFQNLPYFLTYTANWFVLLEGRVIFYFAWSLAAEEQFYLVWPTIEKLFTPRRALVVVCMAIILVTMTQLLSSGGVHAERSLLHRMVSGVPLAICFGVVLAHALHDARTFAALRWVFGHRASVFIWLGALVASLSWRASPEVLIHASAAMLVGACVYREDHLLAPLLRLPGVAHVGIVSYGIYLLHMLVKNAIVQLAGAAHVEIPTYGTFALTVVGSIVVATLSFRYFESAFLRMKRRFAAS